MIYYKAGSITVSDEIYNAILIKIADGEWPVGEKLPSENQLCNMFDASRASVRAALQKLQGSGFIETRQGIGSFVVKNPSEKEEKGEKELSRLEHKDFFEFRQALEFKAIELFAQRATPKDEEELENIAMEMRKAENKEQFADLDAKFHIFLIRASKNSFLIKSLEANEYAIYQYIREILDRTTESLDELADEHLAVCKALSEKKVSLAKKKLFTCTEYYRSINPGK